MERGAHLQVLVVRINHSLVLRTLLFLVFIDDPTAAVKAPAVCSLTARKLSVSPSTEGTRHRLCLVTEAENVAGHRKMQTFDHPSRKNHKTPQTCGPRVVNGVRELKELGVIIHEALKPSTQCAAAYGKADWGLNQL